MGTRKIKQPTEKIHTFLSSVMSHIVNEGICSRRSALDFAVSSSPLCSIATNTVLKLT